MLYNCNITYMGPAVKTITKSGVKKTPKPPKPLKTELDGYKEVSVRNYKNLQPGQRIKYSINNELRYGGYVAKNMFPDYLVLLNVNKKITWSMQFKEPTLKVYIQVN